MNWHVVFCVWNMNVRMFTHVLCCSQAKQLLDEYHSFILSGDRDTMEKSKIEAKHGMYDMHMYDV